MIRKKNDSESILSVSNKKPGAESFLLQFICINVKVKYLTY